MRYVQVLVMVVCGLCLHKAQSGANPTPNFQCDAQCSSADASYKIDGLKAALTSVQLDLTNLERDQLVLQQLLTVAGEGCDDAGTRSKSFSAGGASDSKDRDKVQRVIRSGSVKSGSSSSQTSCSEVLALTEKMRQTVVALDVDRAEIAALEGQGDGLRRYLASVTDAENKARLAAVVVPEAIVAIANKTPVNQAGKPVTRQSPSEVPAREIAKQSPAAVPNRLTAIQPPVAESMMVSATRPVLDAALERLILACQSRWLDRQSICADALPSHVAYPVF